MNRLEQRYRNVLLLTLTQYLSPDQTSWITAGAVEALAVAAVGVPLATTAAGALHRLPAQGDPR